MENKADLTQEIGYSQLEIPEISNFSDQNADFEDLGKEKISVLKEAISDIQILIQERQDLSLEILGEGEILKTEINNFLLDNDNPELTDRDALMEKTSLRSKKIAISELQLNEKIDCWKDIAVLKKELRIYEKELKERQGRIESLNKLLRETE